MMLFGKAPCKQTNKTIYLIPSTGKCLENIFKAFISIKLKLHEFNWFTFRRKNSFVPIRTGHKQKTGKRPNYLKLNVFWGEEVAIVILHHSKSSQK